MRIKKFNEQHNLKEYQKQEILEIFLDLIDNQKGFLDDEDDNDQYINFNIEIESINIMDNISDIDHAIQKLNHNLEIFNSLKTQLKRLTDVGYNWEVIYLPNEIIITIYFNIVSKTIENAFGTKDRVFLNIPILKYIFKKKYNLTYIRHTQIYDDESNKFIIYVEESINRNTLQIIKDDIMSIKKYEKGIHHPKKPFFRVVNGRYIVPNKKEEYYIEVEYNTY
jgi:hypothetical protein